MSREATSFPPKNDLLFLFFACCKCLFQDFLSLEFNQTLDEYSPVNYTVSTTRI
jgi:hypothetical protein